MDDLMARTMIENLSIGIHPLTGKALPKQDACSNEVIQEALKAVLEHCSLESYATIRAKRRKEKAAARAEKKQQRADRYPNQGTPWTPQEEWKLRAFYQNGYPIPYISNILKRSPQTVHAHIQKLRLKPPAL